MSSAPEPSPTALARALAERGLAVRVEAVGRLAVIHPRSDQSIDWAAERREVVRLASLHGFSNAAVELRAEAAGGDGETRPAAAPPESRGDT